eukprot:scaffold18426_cov31-Tisochrysis_lutea.AAC.1
MQAHCALPSPGNGAGGVERLLCYSGGVAPEPRAARWLQIADLRGDKDKAKSSSWPHKKFGPSSEQEAFFLATQSPQTLLKVVAKTRRARNHIQNCITCILAYWL